MRKTHRPWIIITLLMLCHLSIVAGAEEVGKLQGRVLDTNHQPLPGVIVSVKKSKANGTQTDVDGRFSLTLSNTDVIRFSYIGFQTKEVVWRGEETMEIVLQEDSELLNELVVVGYGVQKKVNLSGAVDQISQKDLERRPITDISRGLQGMVPNLNIDFSSGEPGQNASINIRGLSSINGSSPLILIDGIPSSASDYESYAPDRYREHLGDQGLLLCRYLWRTCSLRSNPHQHEVR